MRIWLLIGTGLFGFGAQFHGQIVVGATPPAKPVYHMPPAMTEVDNIEWKRLVNGKIEASEWTVTSIRDSSGRFGQVNQYTDGSTHVWVNDWIAGTSTFWKADEPHTSRLHFPMAQVGRNSCWRTVNNLYHAGLPESSQCYAYDPKSPPNGPQQYCRAPSDSQAEILPDPHAKDPVTDELQLNRCSDWSSSRQQVENLGTKKSPFGTIWGCRMSKSTVYTKFTDEKWIEEHGIVVSDDFDNQLTQSHIVHKLRSLNFEEPDPARFRPPKDYEVEDLQMEEVPCPPPSSQ